MLQRLVGHLALIIKKTSVKRLKGLTVPSTEPFTLQGAVVESKDGVAVAVELQAGAKPWKEIWGV